MSEPNSITSDCENGLICTQKPENNDIISVAEFKKYFGSLELSDEKVKDINNNLVGIVNSVINFYLEGFK